MALIAIFLTSLSVLWVHYLLNPYPSHTWAQPILRSSSCNCDGILPTPPPSNTGAIPKRPRPIDNFEWDDRDQIPLIAAGVAQGLEAVEVERKLKEIFKKKTYSDRQIRRYYKEINEGDRTNTKRKTCPGSGKLVTATSVENEEMLEVLMGQTRKWNIDQLADVMNISHGSVSTLLKRASWHKVGAIWRPHELDCEDFEQRLKVAQTNYDNFTSNANMLGRIFAVDETWMPSYSPLHPQDAREWRRVGEDRPEIVRAGLWDWKIMMIMAAHQDQIIALDFFDTKENGSNTVNSAKYVRFLKTCISYLTDKGETKPLLLADNARVHTSYESMDYFEEIGLDLLPHPRYSPDLNPLDFDIFWRIKRPLRGKRFNSPAELKTEVRKIVKKINDNHECIGMQNLPFRWQQVIENNGDYI